MRKFMNDDCRAILRNVALLGILISAGGSMKDALAQTAVDGAVAGTVVDDSGASLTAATVVVHNTAKNSDTTVTTDGSGYFRATRLEPGDYTVTVNSTGFAAFSEQHVVVEVGRLTEITPKLGAAGSTTTVDVSSDAPIMNTESSDVTTEFSPKALDTLPINGRHWTSFALLSPGVTLGNSSFGLVSFRG